MKARRLAPKSTRPETLRQAQTWDTTKNKYVDLGLCDVCAAQAAWGHQVGFTLSHPPCTTCALVVAMLPVSAGVDSLWRRIQKGTSTGRGQDLISALHSPGGTTPADSEVAADMSGQA